MTPLGHRLGTGHRLLSRIESSDPAITNPGFGKQDSSGKEFFWKGLRANKLQLLESGWSIRTVDAFLDAIGIALFFFTHPHFADYHTIFLQS